MTAESASNKQATITNTKEPRMAKRKRGQPTKYSPENAQSFCAAVANGASAVAAARDINVNASTIYEWLDAHPEFSNNYARARAMRGDHYGAKVAEIADQCLAGEIEPAQARVAIDGYKWTAARMAPKQWSEKRQVDLNVDGSIQHQHTHKSEDQLIDDLKAIRERHLASRAAEIAELIEPVSLPSE